MTDVSQGLAIAGALVIRASNLAEFVGRQLNRCRTEVPSRRCCLVAPAIAYIQCFCALFQAIFTEFAKPGASFAMKPRSVDYVFIPWSAETADKMYEMGTDTFVVRNGHSRAFTRGDD